MKSLLFRAAALALVAGTAQAAEPQDAMQAILDSQIRGWMNAPVIVDAIRAQNAETGGYDLSTIESLDQTWRGEVGLAATPLIDSVLISAASDFLRDQVAASGGAITEVFVMDALGLNVAASGVTSDYWQGDEAKFTETYPNGAGAVHFSEIEFDESSQSYQAQISITLTDAGGAPIGAMTVGIIADQLM